MSNYLEDALTNWLNGSAFLPTLSSGIYLALFSSDPTELSSGGTEITTIITGSSSRVNLPSNWGTRTTGGIGQIINTNLITITSAATGEAVASHWALFNSAVGGDKLLQGSLVESKPITTGDRVEIIPGGLVVTFN